MDQRRDIDQLRVMDELRVIDQLRVRGARVHNLQNVDVDLPRNRLVVITGPSGSGKSSLAFDTIYAEGQRRYVESLSAYARQFLEQMPRPDCDSIEGLSPAIAIAQQGALRNPRSTVGTITEVYDYLRLLYARVGRVRCHGCGREITAFTVPDIVDRVMALPPGTRFIVVAPVLRGAQGPLEARLEDLQQAGYSRVAIDGEVYDLSVGLPALPAARAGGAHDVDVHVDRLVVKEGVARRLADSVELALGLANGVVSIVIVPGSGDGPAPGPARDGPMTFSQRFACADCGITYPELEPRMFSFNNPQGACPACNGLGVVEPGEHGGRSGGEPGRARKRGRKSEDDEVEDDADTGDDAADMVQRPCEACAGTGLRVEARHVTVGGRTLVEVGGLALDEGLAFFEGLALAGREREIADRLLREIIGRLGFLVRVGLDYLSLDRRAATLSGGEGQRIRLATQLGASLVGVLYVLDEPSIGLHPRDNGRLLEALLRLRDQGNTVLVVEHDAHTMRSADYLVDMGPGAGVQGGRVVATGTPAEIMARPDSLTGQYLDGTRAIETRPWQQGPGPALVLRGARVHNLQSVDVSFPLGVRTCVTGVSGSGKSSLVIDTLLPAVRAHLARRAPALCAAGLLGALEGAQQVDRVVCVDQSPIGRTPRSNPASYMGIFALIRERFAALPESRARGYRARRFSFNVKGGRCEACQGAGVLRIEMRFLPDVLVTCERCEGRRYSRETLDIRYKGLDIAQVLDQTVDEALDMWAAVPQIRARLETMRDVGLGYVTLGQPASTLSGGEGQRLKLSRELARRDAGRTLYILDEPTVGLHFEDVRKLLHVLDLLVAQGNSVIVIEHDVDVIKTSDHVIDVGPEGGRGGGRIVGTGTPADIAAIEGSHTGHFLRQALARAPG